MHITSEQSRAARALLGTVTQKDAAKATGLSPSKLSNFENPEVDYNPGAKFLSVLERFYEESGIEFLERDGVRRKIAGLVELNGYDGFKQFIYDVYETVKHGGDVCVTNVDERQFERWQGGHASDYLQKMSTISGLRFRILVQEDDHYCTASGYAVYRALSRKHFSGVPTYVYGSKKAEILFEENDVTIIVVDNQRLADAQRKEFELAWELSGA